MSWLLYEPTHFLSLCIKDPLENHTSNDLNLRRYNRGYIMVRKDT